MCIFVAGWKRFNIWNLHSQSEFEMKYDWNKPTFNFNILIRNEATRQLDNLHNSRTHSLCVCVTLYTKSNAIRIVKFYLWCWHNNLQDYLNVDTFKLQMITNTKTVSYSPKCSNSGTWASWGCVFLKFRHDLAIEYSQWEFAFISTKLAFIVILAERFSISTTFQIDTHFHKYERRRQQQKTHIE